MDLSPRFTRGLSDCPPDNLCVVLLRRGQHAWLQDDEAVRGLGMIPADAGSDTSEAAESNSGQAQPRWNTIARRLITISLPHAP